MILTGFLLLVSFGAFYSWFVLRVWWGLSNLGPQSVPNKRIPFVSAVVAARNEAGTIEKCISAILEQNYPGNKFEVIVVDDNSTDSTADLVKKMSKKFKNLRLYKLSSRRSESIGRKPESIALAVSVAKGEIILTTDSDCQVPRTWLKSMTKDLTEDVMFQAGPVVEAQTGSFLNKLESLEFMSLIVTGAGLIGAGRPIICNGANLAYRKSAFNAVRGFKGTASSNDDETLMQRIFNRNIGKVRFVADPDAVVRTESNNNLWSFLKQRQRWAAKKGRYEDKTILAELVLLYFFCFVLLGTAGASFFVPELRIPVAGVFGVKIVLDYLAMHRGSRLLKQKLNGLVFLVAELFHVPYIVFTGAVGQFVPQEWKGRSLDR